MIGQFCVRPGWQARHCRPAVDRSGEAGSRGRHYRRNTATGVTNRVVDVADTDPPEGTGTHYGGEIDSERFRTSECARTRKHIVPASCLAERSVRRWNRLVQVSVQQPPSQPV